MPPQEWLEFSLDTNRVVSTLCWTSLRLFLHLVLDEGRDHWPSVQNTEPDSVIRSIMYHHDVAELGLTTSEALCAVAASLQNYLGIDVQTSDVMCWHGLLVSTLVL